MDVQQELREALSKSKESRADISRRTGLAESILSRFVRGMRGMDYATMERLAEALGYEIILRRRKER